MILPYNIGHTVDSMEALELRALKASEANKALRTQQEAEAGSKLWGIVPVQGSPRMLLVI